VEFHPLTLATIQAVGGLRRLGNTTANDMPFVRAQLVKTFETLLQREVKDRCRLPSVREYKQLQASQAVPQLAARLKAAKAKRD
jgi:hypothetical protein